MDSRTEEVPMSKARQTWLVVRCRTMRWHSYRRVSNPDGQGYLACSVCGHEWDRGIPIVG
jgi:hypothetical protein